MHCNTGDKEPKYRTISCGSEAIIIGAITELNTIA